MSENNFRPSVEFFDESAKLCQKFCVDLHRLVTKYVPNDDEKVKAYMSVIRSLFANTVVIALQKERLPEFMVKTLMTIHKAYEMEGMSDEERVAAINNLRKDEN